MASLGRRVSDGLMRGFVRRSLWLVIISCIALSMIIPYLMYYSDLEHYKAESVYLISRFIEKDLDFDLKQMLSDTNLRARMVARIDAFMTASSLVEFKLWASDTTNVYSYVDPSMIGKRFTDNRDLLDTLESMHAEVEVEEPHDQENISLKKYGRIFEIYVPVLKDGKAVGAVEVYRLAPSYKLVGPHTFMVPLVAIGLFILVYTIMYGSFKGAARRIMDYDERLGDSYATLGRSYFDTIRSLIKALEFRDMETEGHSERVVALSVELANRMALNRSEKGKLILGAYLHDIGKIGISDNILLKQGRLNEDERKVMKTHVSKGYEIIRDINILSDASDVVLGHHEKWDGSGYPSGIKGENIPVSARIFALVDVFDALMSKRPYKEAFSYEETCGIIKTDSGYHFDPRVVEAFETFSKQEIMAIMSEAEFTKIAAYVNDVLTDYIAVKTTA